MGEKMTPHPPPKNKPLTTQQIFHYVDCCQGMDLHSVRLKSQLNVSGYCSPRQHADQVRNAENMVFHATKQQPCEPSSHPAGRIQ